MSSSSTLIPSGKLQSNPFTIFASTNSFVAMANEIPGQPLLPAPNGISSKSCPRKSTLQPSFKNLSGMNSSGCSQIPGSLPIAHAFTIVIVPAGTWYPSISTLREGFRGTK
ncbi:unnamed protein product, partial [Linum tenue]